MARFMVKASEFKNVCKAVNDRQLERIKKIIFINVKFYKKKRLLKS